MDSILLHRSQGSCVRAPLLLASAGSRGQDAERPGGKTCGFRGIQEIPRQRLTSPWVFSKSNSHKFLVLLPHRHGGVQAQTIVKASLETPS
jgi:hypothetical protein